MEDTQAEDDRETPGPYFSQPEEARFGPEDLVKASSRALMELKRIQEEFEQSADLDERENACRQKLAELIQEVKSEPNPAVQISRDSLKSSFKNVSTGYLVSDLVVVATDSAGRFASKPLEGFAPEAILAISRESMPMLKKLVSEKRDVQTARIALLEEMIRGLEEVNTVQPEVAMEPAPESFQTKEEEAPEEPMTVAPIQPAKFEQTESQWTAEWATDNFNLLADFQDRSSEEPEVIPAPMPTTEMVEEAVEPPKVQAIKPVSSSSFFGAIKLAFQQ